MLLALLIVKCLFVFSIVCLLFYFNYICISFCIVIVFLQFDLNESRLSRSLQRTSKYAPNMREPKNERKTSANPPDTFEASFRTEAPDSAADRASRSPKPVGVVVHRLSLVVPRSLFIVASCRSCRAR